MQASTAPCPSTQQPDCSSELIYNILNNLQCLLTLKVSALYSTLAQECSGLLSKIVPPPYIETAKVLDASALPEFLLRTLSLSGNYFYSSCLSATQSCPLQPGHVTSLQQPWHVLIFPSQAMETSTVINPHTTYVQTVETRVRRSKMSFSLLTISSHLLCL